MKVFTASQMRDLEKCAFEQGASEETFMENAGRGIADAVMSYAENHQTEKNILLLCGKGNNSGDAYVAGRYLLKQGFRVFCLQLVPINLCSPLCKKNHQSFLNSGGNQLDFLQLPKKGLILDGLFGTGFNGSLKEPFKSIINLINHSKLPILSIDIPSGLNGDDGKAEEGAIQATQTFYLDSPKTGFFINDGWNYVGELVKVDFGLPLDIKDQAKTRLHMLTSDFIKSILPPVQRTWHKYSKGYVVAIAGSKDMPGAAILSTKAAMRGGAGIVRLIHQENMLSGLSSAPLELVRQTYSFSDLKPVMDSVNKSTASYIGPGIGRAKEINELLSNYLENIKVPCVLDADALTLLSENPRKLPAQSILTPHHGELLRLLGKNETKLSTEEIIELAQQYVDKNNIILVLKGAPTFILQPEGDFYVCPRGSPGLATAGTGDVLTGIITALLSRKLTPLHAAILGVYLHAISGEIAANKLSVDSMIASDVIDQLPEAYKSLKRSPV